MKNNIVIRQLIEWIFAIVIAVVIINSILFLTYHPAPWINTDRNATQGLFQPGSTIVYGEEGYGIRKVDKNGYANPDRRLENSSYILFMGSSHTVGKEVNSGKNYVDIIEAEYGKDVYSIAMDGHMLPQLISGFNAAMKQFPNASAVVIEISTTDYLNSDIKECLNQREYDESLVGENIVTTSSTKDKIKLTYQNYFPLIRAINKNFKADNKIQQTETLYIYDENGNVSDTYISLLDDALKLIRSEYDGKIIIIYHPAVMVNEDGTLCIIDSDSKDEFEKCCNDSDIVFLDTGDGFISEYEKTHKLPYGFANSVYGTGHLNSTGHRIMADKIMEEIGGDK